LAALAVASGVLCGASDSSTCRDGFEVNAVGMRELFLKINPSQVRIVGTQDKKVRVRCELRDEDPSRVKIQWSGGVSSARLTVSGGRAQNQKFRIEVPEHSDLTVRVTAGDVSIRGVEGSKDVEMTAGDLKIEVGRPGDYSMVDTSVRVGDLDAIAFGQKKGGLFRSFNRRNSYGKYTLHASLGAGNLTLE